MAVENYRNEKRLGIALRMWSLRRASAGGNGRRWSRLRGIAGRSQGSVAGLTASRYLLVHFLLDSVGHAWACPTKVWRMPGRHGREEWMSWEQRPDWARGVGEFWHLHSDLDMDPDDSASPWQDNAESLRDTEWSKISTEFMTVSISCVSLISCCPKPPSRSATARASLPAKNPLCRKDSTRASHEPERRLAVVWGCTAGRQLQYSQCSRLEAPLAVLAQIRE